jgi:DNA polymerase III delta prime subunit
MKPESDYSTGGKEYHSEGARQPFTKQELLAIIKQSRELMHSAAQPLTAVLALTELLSKAETLDETVFEDLNVILEQAYLLQSIFHDLNEALSLVDTEE